MAYNLQEQEQIDELRAFWQRWGTPILAVVTVALLAYAGYKGWDWYQWRQAQAASSHYGQVLEAVDRKDAAAIKSRSQDVMNSYKSTVFAQMAGLVAGRALLDGGDRAGAADALRWVADNGRNAEFRLLARLRLSALQLDDKAWDQALATLNSPDLEASSPDLKAEFADRRADILFASGKPKEARAEYDRALTLATPQNALREAIELKRDAIRG